jgi:hypothetical protein
MIAQTLLSIRTEHSVEVAASIGRLVSAKNWQDAIIWPSQTLYSLEHKRKSLVATES